MDVRERRGLDVIQVAVEVVCVVPVDVGVLRHVEPRESAIGLVQHVDLYFVTDYTLLIFQIFIGNSQATHAVSLAPESSLELVGRNDFEIVGEVEAGGVIEDSAVLLDEPHEFHLAEIL